MVLWLYIQDAKDDGSYGWHSWDIAEVTLPVIYISIQVIPTKLKVVCQHYVRQVKYWFIFVTRCWYLALLGFYWWDVLIWKLLVATAVGINLRNSTTLMNMVQTNFQTNLQFARVSLVIATSYSNCFSRSNSRFIIISHRHSLGSF